MHTFNCQNCGKKYQNRKKTSKYCSLECRVVPIKIHPVGKVYGWLKILSEIEPSRDINNSHKRRFKCKCKCGNIVIRTLDGIQRAKTPSCGCFMVYFATNRIKHGMSKTKIYKVWAALKVRCYKKHDPSYKKYGAKGVTVCKRWELFENFYEDMGSTYKEGLSIDRFPNKRGNYEPCNCRWATDIEQARNISTNRILNVTGIKLCASEFAAVLGISNSIIYYRIKKGWNDTEAVLGKEEKLYFKNLKKLNKYYEGIKK